MIAALHLSLICRVLGRLCAVPLPDVMETMRPLPVQPWPDAPAFVRGFSIIRGLPVPVLDGAYLVEGEAAIDAGGASPERFVAVRVGHRCVALAVDGVLGVQPIGPELLLALPPLLRNAETASAIGVLDEQLLVVLHGARLLPQPLPEPPAPGGAP